jgi:uncharacterized protein
MPRPQGVQSDNILDALVRARAGTTIERSFAAADLPRLREAGALDGSSLTVRLRFSQFDGRVAIDGELDGVAVLICQRCMQPADVPLQEHFSVIVVQDEAELAQEPGGYEPILANPAHLDLQMLAEDQALLALPLVPRHESDECNEAQAPSPASVDEDDERRRPFGNLRDLMRKR